MRNERDQTTPRAKLWMALIISGFMISCIMGLLLPRPKPNANDQSRTPATPTATLRLTKSKSNTPSSSGDTTSRKHQRRASAAQIVARKAAQFARSRREVLYALARKKNLAVPAEVEQFFDAAEAGNWEQMDALFKKLQAERKLQPHPPELDQLWAPILTTLNALQQVHLWPAQEYLDYGNTILNSLRPGMVYVGGTDPGRGIPELLSATAEGEQHIVITQNGLADSVYLDYLRFQYGDRMNLPSAEQAQAARADYAVDYQKRLAHDQQFPDEPKQILPGERAGGPQDFGDWSQTSIMFVNERIMQSILQANPDLSFGLEESFPLKSTYADAGTLGSIFELRGQQDQNPLTADTASQSIAFWQNTTQQLLADPAAADSPDWLKAYGKMADAQANLFAAHGLNDQAEQVFRLSLQISPGLPEPVFGYVRLLMDEQRPQDALAIAQSAARANPANQQFQNLVTQLQGAH